MSRLSKFSTAGALTYASALLATSVCSPDAALAQDDRLVSQLYDSDAVVRVTGRLGVQATIGFGDKESIENVAVGDAESWQITPNKRADLLFVKPLQANGRTNMTVVTDKHTYFFDLVASPSATPFYMLRFTYKDEPKPSPSATLGNAELPSAEGDLAAASTDPAALNFAWLRKGDAGLLPARIYDDGLSTYLHWDAKQQIPAILVLNEKGEEGPVNYAVRGAAIVIDAVPGRIMLRIGKKSASLENQHPAGSGQDADTARAPLALAAPHSAVSGAQMSAASGNGATRKCPPVFRFIGGPYGGRRLVKNAQC